MPRDATADELRGLTAPVMVFAAEHDPLFPPGRVLPAVRALFPNLLAAETLAGCHHILDADCAASLCERIGPFLEAAS
jgi:pimeloyl-ACP methyl ester carboxylesterase